MLDAQELKFIFGNLPPIHEVHKRMRNDLLQLAHNWSDDASIGDIILKYVSMKASQDKILIDSVLHDRTIACIINLLELGGKHVLP